jgi:hypothetical protein
MAFWNIFKRKKEKEEPTIEEVIIETSKDKWQECFYCKQDMFRGDRWTKQQGKFFHRNCYKEMIKEFK